jgi:CII-binding regulator of phage lambda lysogenization HflD
MILMSEDVYKFARKKYAKYVVTMVVLFTSVYTLSRKLAKQEEVITILTKRINKLDKPCKLESVKGE